jgi:hypothetical protein
MRSTLRFGIGAVALMALVGYAMSLEGEAKHTIKDVMQKAHKGGLLKKAVDGKASKDEVKDLVELYESLPANKPPKGDEKAWKEKTEALISAAKAFAANEQGGKQKLQKASNCKACHDTFK